jgi:signal transduction histidine kinase
MTAHDTATRAELEKTASLHWFHWTVVALSLLLTFGAFFYSRRQVDEKREAQFDREAERVVTLVEERMQKYEDALWAGVAHVNAIAEEVSEDGWRRYATSLRIGEKYPGINGIGIIQALDRSELPGFLDRVRRERPGFEVYPAHDGPESMPITHIEPVALNAAAIGLDIAHEKKRYAAATKARDTGKAQITGPVVLAQDEGRTPGFCFYAPYYTPLGDQRVFEGMVHAPFVVKDLMDGVLARGSRHVGLRIADGEEVLFDEHVEEHADFDPDPQYVRVETREMYGRQWEFDVWSAMSFRDAHRSSLPGLILVGGILIDGLLLGLFFIISRANRRALDFADAVTRELKVKADDLESSNRELESFAYVASHDLQEPLRMVGSFGALLGDKYSGQFDEKGERWLGFMVDGATRMQSLVQGLLEYSRVGHKGDPPVVVRTGELVDVLLHDLAEVITEADAVVTRDELPDVLGQPTAVRQVFQNILSNAIKFRTADRQAIVHLGVTMKNGESTFFIEDNGIGIDPEYAERIFVIFQRLHSDASYSGTGIGLAVSKKVVENYGGRMWFESQEGEGTTFYFTLPPFSEPAAPVPARGSRSICSLPIRRKLKSKA